MTTQTPIEIIEDSAAIAEIGQRIASSGRFAMDLEFTSADRFIPELALVQLAWTEEGEQQMVLIDGVDTELVPIFDLVESESVLLIAHGAKQDLSLLAMRYQVRAGAFMDTQIAAAFAGIAEQIGYANLVDRLLGMQLDKGPQFTDWLRRPLSAKQLRYALDDVRYLFPVWDKLRVALDRSERRSWAQEESTAMAALASERRPSEEAYKNIGGANNLKGSALGALRELAAWRDRLAVAENTPPSWIIPDAAAVEACRRNLKSERDFKKVRGLGAGTARKYGAQILEAIQKGRQAPVEGSQAKKPLDAAGQAQAGVVTAMVAGRAAEIAMPPRSIAAKADAEALVRHARGQAAGECKLLQGWRGQVIGQVALRWLRGEGHVVADTKLGVRVELPETK